MAHSPAAQLSPTPAAPLDEAKVATPMGKHKRRFSKVETGEVSGDHHRSAHKVAYGVGEGEHVEGEGGKGKGLEGGVMGGGMNGIANGTTNDTTGSEKVQHDEADGRPSSSGSGVSDWSGAGQLRRLSSSNGTDITDSAFIENMADTVELEPYKAVNEDDEGYGDNMIRVLLPRLRRMGPDDFLTDLFSREDVTPKLLGTVFGIHPEIYDVYGDDFHMRLLVEVVDRAWKKREKLMQHNTIDDAATLLRNKCHILVITGAGISTSLGIPDFRSNDIGFYAELKRSGIAQPEEVFDITTFDDDPSKFYNLVGRLLPELNRYSPTHKFLRMLQDRGKLQTIYTQNIDNLEQLAGIQPDQLIQCHGSFATASCRKCGHQVAGSEIEPEMRAQKVPYCKICIDRITAESLAPKRKKHRATAQRPRNRHAYGNYDDDDIDDDIPTPGVMKPDIIFFGEQLPETFFSRFQHHDCKTVDLVIVIGTSMKVSPVSEMPNHLPKQVPHIYINKEPVDHVNFDIQLLGKCDDVVFELARRAGWQLQHERIEEGVRFDVDPVEGKAHHWKVMKLMK